MRSYNSYHTTLKQLAKKDCLPASYKNELDRTTLWRWKQESPNKYIGKELNNIEVLDDFLNKSEAQKLMKSYLKVTYTLINLLNIGKQIHYTLKQNRSIFIRTILKYKKNIDIKLILRLCKIPLSVFYSWKNRVLIKCDTSALMICKKTYPNQLTSFEVSTMKNLLLDERFKFWPVCSIAYYALREKLLSVSLATWYLYRKKLGIARPIIPKKKKHSIGIRASLPNQIWHADITIVKTKDNIKHYVYLLMDNFSKYILNCRVEAYVSGKVRMETIRDTYNKHIMNSQEVNLIVDGGPENNNSEIKGLTDNNTIRLNKLIALKDIPFSNSLIEAQNKLLKYRYLFRQEFNTIEELRKLLECNVNDYNNIRPHISLEGLTPQEAYSGSVGTEFEWKKQIIEAKLNRLLVNRKELCQVCI